MQRRKFLSQLGSGFSVVFGGAVFAPLIRDRQLHGHVTPRGKAIGKTSKVPVGGSATFAAPMPSKGIAAPIAGIVIQPSKGVFKAYSSACTHQGCPVSYAKSTKQFLCPCHGSVFSQTGSVVSGVAPLPLPQFTVTISNGTIYVR
jgi:Rieske Fe-S protein